MAIMTEEEADALDELLTKTTPKVNPDVRGITAQAGERKGFRMVPIDEFSAEYLSSRALATRQTPEEIIHALVSKEIAAVSN